ncbi:hypothetical protein CJF59_13560 [Acetobacter pomorum]|uniref:Uncharacterized protein n=2 Tax=Acetobacter TaxID=434 RepID=A0AAN1UA42_9PROT|nr:hypothetical protein CJF59_13560 [Acetobacter pomorum]
MGEDKMATIQFRREDTSLMDNYFDHWRGSLPKSPNQIGKTIVSVTKSEGEIIQIDGQVQPYSDFNPIRWADLDQIFIDYLNTNSHIWYQIL